MLVLLEIVHPYNDSLLKSLFTLSLITIFHFEEMLGLKKYIFHGVSLNMLVKVCVIRIDV